jgi:hypothetical protein
MSSQRGYMNGQNTMRPEDNKFHVGNGRDGKHYWLTPPALYAELNAEFNFDFDPCPCPKPDDFDGLTCEWGWSNYVNPPFGSVNHEGRKKGITAWIRKAIEEQKKGKLVVLVYPLDKWVLMILETILGDHAEIRNLRDVKWHARGRRFTRTRHRPTYRLLHLTSGAAGSVFGV